MSHALIYMHPPHGTQIITQINGSIMLKFEYKKKLEMIEMLTKTFQDIEALREVPGLPGQKPTIATPVAKVVPDTGFIPMTMTTTSNPIPDLEVAKHMEEANKRGHNPDLWSRYGSD